MAEPITFSVAVEPATMKSAARRYLLRYLTVEHTWSSVAAAAVIVLSLGLVVFAQALDFTSGFFMGFDAALLAYMAALIWAYWGGLNARLARTKVKNGQIVLRDDGMEMSSEEALSRFPWTRIREIWKFRQVWLLMLDPPAPYLTLPLASTPPEALKFLDRKIKPSPSRGA